MIESIERLKLKLFRHVIRMEEENGWQDHCTNEKEEDQGKQDNIHKI